MRKENFGNVSQKIVVQTCKLNKYNFQVGDYGFDK